MNSDIHATYSINGKSGKRLIQKVEQVKDHKDDDQVPKNLCAGIIALEVHFAAIPRPAFQTGTLVNSLIST